jgi:uncharacterized protein
MQHGSRLSRFRPHPLVRGGHAQTIVGAYLPHALSLSTAVDHRLAMPDGDLLVLHDNRPAAWSPGDGTALLVHGLGGAHHSPYCVRLAARLVERGIRAFRLDMRGCGAGAALARYPGHAGRSEDLRRAILEIERLCPGSPLAAIGYSLGGNIVLKLAGECAGEPPGGLERVAAVCPPIDLGACSHNIGRGLNWIYDRAFLRALVKLVADRARESPEWYAQTPLHPQPRSLFEFDDRITAPLSGFANAGEYYARCSAAPGLARIEVPTLILAAGDDPLIPAHIFDRAERSSAVALHLAEGGGHLGFLAARGCDPDRRWLDWRLLEWLGVA